MPRGKIAYDLSQRTAAFFKKINKTAGGCWLWTGDTHKTGYGLMTSWAGGKRNRWMAHRFSWEIHRGPIPAGMFICHHCDTPPCVNPDHLFCGSPLDNMRDMVRKGRHVKAAPKGDAHYNAKVSSEDVVLVRHLCSNGVRSSVIAKAFGISTSMVGRIKRRQNWKDV